MHPEAKSLLFSFKSVYLNKFTVALAVQLGPRAPHSRSFATIQDGEMDPSPVSCSTTHPIQGIYLLHKLALPYSSQRWVTGQGT